MATNDVRASNIDKNRPIVTKTVIIGDDCKVCGQRTQGKFRFIANELERVLYNQIFDCGNKKPCKGKIHLSGVVNMPRK